MPGRTLLQAASLDVLGRRTSNWMQLRTQEILVRKDAEGATKKVCVFAHGIFAA